MARYYDNYWPPYVSVAERRRRAAKKIASMRKAGRDVSPVEIAGRKIATTFWGQAWCKNLEAYSDYENRLPRGRTYVRNGSVLDLQIEAGRVQTLVSGTDLYTVEIMIKSLARKRWAEIKGRCAGQIDSLVELLQGSISKSVMEIVTRKGEGLFPSPAEIALDCSCPDWATMCKHVAATLYGVGARLDHAPELLFTLRGVDPTEMVEAAIDQPVGNGKARRGRVLETAELSSVFGVDIEMDGVSPEDVSTPTKESKTARRAAKARKSASSRTSKRRATKTATRKRDVTTSTAKRPARKKKSAAKERASTKTTASGPTATKVASSTGAGAAESVAVKKVQSRKSKARTSLGKKSKTGSTKTSAKKSKTASKKTSAKKSKTASKKTSAKKRVTKKATPKRRPAARQATKKIKR